MNQDQALKILIEVANMAQANGMFKKFEDAEVVHNAIKVFTKPAPLPPEIDKIDKEIKRDKLREEADQRDRDIANGEL